MRKERSLENAHPYEGKEQDQRNRASKIISSLVCMCISLLKLKGGGWGGPATVYTVCVRVEIVYSENIIYCTVTRPYEVFCTLTGWRPLTGWRRSQQSGEGKMIPLLYTPKYRAVPVVTEFSGDLLCEKR